MASEIDFQKVCRACLSRRGPMKDLFTISTPEIFNFCTAVKISRDDKLPNKLCIKCSELLNKTYSFKQTVLRSDTVLKQQLNDELQQVKLEHPSNDIEIVELNINQVSEDMVILSENVTIQSAEPENSMEPAEIIRQIRKRRRLVPRPLKNRTKMQCPKCDKSFQKYENFEAHMRSHFGKKPDIKCDQCEKTFPNLRNLHSHARTHSNARKYVCLICGKSFKYLNVLKNHELIHTGVKEHACHLCDAKFVQRYNLKAHLVTHSQQKNYICVQCGKRFSQPGNLKTHLIRHTGIKNIACDLCDMRFYVKSDLFKHMRSHSDNKPFSCEFCDKTFKSKSFKDVHLRTHTGERPYACDICPKRFMSRKDMKNHRMIHTGEKPHKCQVCDQAFIQKCALNRHMKGHMEKDDIQTDVMTLSKYYDKVASSIVRGVKRDEMPGQFARSLPL